MSDIKVLLVEPYEDMRHLIRLILNGSGAQVIDCARPEEALRILREVHFDVVITNTHPHEEESLALIEQLRRQEVERATEPTPAVALATDPLPHETRKRFQVFMRIPFHPERLVEVVRKLYELDGRAVRENFQQSL